MNVNDLYFYMIDNCENIDILKQLNEIIGDNTYRDNTFNEDNIIFQIFCNLEILKVLTVYDKDKKIFDIKGLDFQFRKNDIKRLSFEGCYDVNNIFNYRIFKDKLKIKDYLLKQIEIIDYK